MNHADTQKAPAGARQALTVALPAPTTPAVRWVIVFWPLVAVIAAGATVFQTAIIDSIASTPHPQLVYAIFIVAAVAAGLFALLMNTVMGERVWVDEMMASDQPGQDRLMQGRDPAADLTAIYHLVLNTRGRPVMERQRALEHEIDTIEGQVLARLALPNMLGGSLVGLGLVGTFIGLLATLQDLSGVFAALGGGNAGGDAADMFSNMIAKLKGPMQGMGTAFVASLYGLLGSLIIGLIGVGVKREGERLFGQVRSFVTEELYRDAAMAAASLPVGQPVRLESLVDLIAQEHRLLREALDGWISRLDDRIATLAESAGAMNASMKASVDRVIAESNQTTERLQQARFAEQLVVETVTAAGQDVGERIEGLKSELKIASGRGIMMFGRTGMVLAVLGALAGLAAVIIVVTRSATAPEPAAVVSTAEVTVPVAAGDETVPAAPDSAVPDVGMPAPMKTVAPEPTPAASDPVTPAVAPVVPAMPTAPAEGGNEVVIAKGDTLFALARKNGHSLEELVKANPQLADPDTLEPGQKIKLPQ